MTSPDQIAEAKHAFLQKYNHFISNNLPIFECDLDDPHCFDLTKEQEEELRLVNTETIKNEKLWMDRALTKSTSAALQHNPLYNTKDYCLRKSIREYWKLKLVEIGKEFSYDDPLPFFATIHDDNYDYDEIDNINKTLLQNHEKNGRRSELFYDEKVVELKSIMNEEFGTYFVKGGFRISHSQKSISVYLKHLWCRNMIPMPPQCPVDRGIIKLLPKEYQHYRWTQIDRIEEHRDIITGLQKLAVGTSLAEWELMAFAQIR